MSRYSTRWALILALSSVLFLVIGVIASSWQVNRTRFAFARDLFEPVFAAVIELGPRAIAAEAEQSRKDFAADTFSSAFDVQEAVERLLREMMVRHPELLPEVKQKLTMMGFDCSGNYPHQWLICDRTKSGPIALVNPLNPAAFLLVPLPFYRQLHIEMTPAPNSQHGYWVQVNFNSSQRGFYLGPR